MTAQKKTGKSKV